MSDHDVAVERDGQHGEDGNSQKSVAHEREQNAKRVTQQPSSFVEERRCQWQIETAEHQIGY